MNIIILTPVRLFGYGLSACFVRFPEMSVRAVLDNLASLRNVVSMTAVDLILVDVTQGIDLFDVRIIAAERPDITLVALGLAEREKEVVSCGRAGFAGYVARDATIDELYQSLVDIVRGRLTCSAEMSAHLLRALFHTDGLPSSSHMERTLTRRENEVLQFLARGFANKEIARELSLSVATVKHHVHNVLDKLQLQRRAQVMRPACDLSSIASFPHTRSSVKIAPNIMEIGPTNRNDKKQFFNE